MAAVVGLLMAGQGYAQTNSSGELDVNGDFEAAPANSAAGIPGWTLVREGEAQGTIALDDAAPPGPAGPHALRLDAAALGTRCGVADNGPGGRGINVQNGMWYDVSFFCRTDNKADTGLVFSLESADGRTICARATIPEVGGDWQPFTLSLHAYAGDRHAHLVISPIDPGVLWLDGVSLRPRASR
jgi:hypothetical protein